MATFIKSAHHADEWINDDVVEFCFIGRSNVGKSSLINAMAKSNIAVTSKTPGRTRLVNFFQFKNFRLIDLPGYGFASGSKAAQEDITYIINTYLTSRKNLFGVFQLCDSGVITDADKKISLYINSKFANHFIVLTKTDKIGIKKVKANIANISKYLNVASENIFLVSSKKNEGINDIFNKISALIKYI